MNKLISLFAAVIMAASLFTAPASATSAIQMVNEDVVYADTDCVNKVGAAKVVCLRRMNGSNR